MAGGEQGNLNWVIAPIGNCISYLGEEITQNAVIQRSLINLSGMDGFLNLAKESLIQKNIPTTGIECLIKEHVFLKEKSKEFISSDYNSINSHSLVNLWAIIEATVEDTVILTLQKGKVTLDQITRKGIKVKLNLNLSNESDRRRIYRSIEMQTRNNSNVGEGICNIMKVLNINLNLNNKTNKVLSEVNSVRNCILHRGGILDDKASKDIFIGTHKIGNKINITKAVYMAYFDAIRKLATQLMQAIIESPYIVRTTKATKGSEPF